jgi:20S proteasome subunit beta 6
MFKNQVPTPERPIPEPGTMQLDQVLRIVMDGFTGATERHIEVGDGLEMFVVRTPVTEGETAKAGTASAIDLASLGAVEALGGEDDYKEGACVVIRRELKKD